MLVIDVIFAHEAFVKNHFFWRSWLEVVDHQSS